jgi:mono/diheme cytochrome c family protein
MDARFDRLVIGVAMALAACSARGSVADPEAGAAPVLAPIAGQPGIELPAETRARKPISGGTMLALADGRLAIADVDADSVLVVDPEAGSLVAEAFFARDAHPFRLAQDGSGRVHVTLRGTGELVSLSPDSWEVVARRTVCEASRGVAWDPHVGLVHVACAGGELVSLDPVDLEPVRTVRLPLDLRDVVVDDGGEHLFVSRFRSAEVLALDREGTVVDTFAPASVVARTGLVLPDPTTDGETRLPGAIVPSVAWRMRAMPGGGVAVLHQRASTLPIPALAREPRGSYGGVPEDDGFATPCHRRLVHTAVTVFRVGSAPSTTDMVDGAVLAVDFLRQPGDGSFLVLAAGSSAGSNTFVLPASATYEGAYAEPGCVTSPVRVVYTLPLSTSLALDSTGRAWVFDRSFRAVVRLDGERIELPGGAGWRGALHDFHAQIGAAPIACASCHPEGTEDGHVWTFEGMGLRRTQTTAGGIETTAPFHWKGDVPDLEAIIEGNMTRMGVIGPHPSARDLERLLAAIPAPAPVRAASDPLALTGEELFTGSAGCVGCHAGSMGTMDESIDVGTGAPFQVPHLVGVAQRAPFMHDGCAPTLRDVLVGCEGDAPHAGTVPTDSAIDALIAYLETR